MSVIICYKVEDLQKCQCLEEKRTIILFLGHYAPVFCALLFHFHRISLEDSFTLNVLYWKEVLLCLCILTKAWAWALVARKELIPPP